MKPRIHRPSHRPRRLALSVLSLALLGALSIPAFAADTPCKNPDGTDVSPAPSTDQGNEAGPDNTTCKTSASAFGTGNNASAVASSAFGNQNFAYSDGSSAFGYWNKAYGVGSSAFGGSNTALGSNSSAFGTVNSAVGMFSSAFGHWNHANGDNSSAFGEGNWANGDGSSAFGNSNTASGDNSAAFGYGNTASALGSSAFGYINKATGNWSTAIGAGSVANAERSMAIGFQTVANESDVVSFGHAAGDLDVFGNAYGSDYNARLIHVAAGVDDTDAVNLGQLNAALSGITGFTGWNLSAAGGATQLIGNGDTVDFAVNDPNGNLTVSRSGNTITYGLAGSPTFLGLTVGGGGAHFTIVNNTVVNMGGNVVGGVANGVAATDAVNVGQLNTVATAASNAQTSADNAQNTADAAMTAASNAQSTADAAMTAANNAQASADQAQATADHAQASADHAQTTADTALAAAGSALTDAKDYTDTRETAIRSDMTAGDAATLASSKAYTDQRFAAWNDTFTQYQHQVDARFAQTDTRINRIGAMGTAMTQMAVNAAIGTSPNGRLAVGLGTQGGQGAISIGYGRRVGSTGSFSIGASFASGESSVGAGFGIDL